MKYYIITFIFFLIGCRRENSSLDVVDIVQAFDKSQEIMLSDFVECIDYIVLETKDHPIDRDLKVYISGNNLICITLRQIYLFDRQTGKFIREIGKYGKGPGEYLFSKYFDDETQHVYVVGNGRDLFEYNLDDKMTRVIVNPSKSTENSNKMGFSDDGWYLFGSIFLDKNTITYYNNNFTGGAKDRLVIADEDGNIIKIISNSNRFIWKDMSISAILPIFYHHEGNTLFFENCVDTIYRVTREELIPYFRLEMGKYKPHYEKKNLLMEPKENPLMSQYFIFNNIGETDKFLFFDFSHGQNFSLDFLRYSFFGYYNKKSGITKIANLNRTLGRCILNDIDNFSAIQLSSWTINRHNEMISYIEAGDILNWFRENPGKVNNLPEHVQSLSKLHLEDNPVVVIAKLK